MIIASINIPISYATSRKKYRSSVILIASPGSPFSFLWCVEGAGSKKRRKTEQGKLVKRSKRQQMEGSRENEVKCQREQGAGTPLTEPLYSDTSVVVKTDHFLEAPEEHFSHSLS